MRKRFSIFLSIFASLTNGESFATSGLQLGVGASALGGVNVTGGYVPRRSASGFLRKFGFRVDLSSTTPVKSIMNSAVRSVMGDGVHAGSGLEIYQGQIHGRQAGALIDFYPAAANSFWRGLRVTGGFFAGDLTLDTKLTGPYHDAPANAFVFKLFGTYYYYAGNIVSGTAKIDWDYSGPYLGVGFDVPIWRNFALYLDVGAVFSGRAAHLTLNMPFKNLYQYDEKTDAWHSVNSPQLQKKVDELKNQAVDDANRELSSKKILPILKLGFLYRF